MAIHHTCVVYCHYSDHGQRLNHTEPAQLAATSTQEGAPLYSLVCRLQLAASLLLPPAAVPRLAPDPLAAGRRRSSARGSRFRSTTEHLRKRSRRRRAPRTCSALNSLPRRLAACSHAAMMMSRMTPRYGVLAASEPNVMMSACWMSAPPDLPSGLQMTSTARCAAHEFVQSDWCGLRAADVR
jgi:hypothetical protein